MGGKAIYNSKIIKTTSNWPGITTNQSMSRNKKINNEHRNIIQLRKLPLLGKKVEYDPEITGKVMCMQMPSVGLMWCEHTLEEWCVHTRQPMTLEFQI